MPKYIEIIDAGYVWRVPLHAIADNRAKFYAERDKDTTYEDEFNAVMEDNFEGLDWFLNNMNFEDVADKAVLVETPKPLIAPRMNADSCECDLIDVDE